MGNQQATLDHLRATGGGGSLQNLKDLLCSTSEAFDSFCLECESMQSGSRLAAVDSSLLASPSRRPGSTTTNSNNFNNTKNNGSSSNSSSGKPADAFAGLLPPSVAQQTVGNRCVTWHSTPAHEPAYVESTVVAVREGRALSDGTTAAARIVLDSGAEVDLPTLARSLRRAQNALAVEAEWLMKLREASLYEGSTVDLWVPSGATGGTSGSLLTAPPSATAAGSQAFIPSAASSASVSPRAEYHSTSQAARESPRRCKVGVSGRFGSGALGRSGSTSSLSSAGSAGSVAEAAECWESGDLLTYTVREVQISWNYQDAEVAVVVARNNIDGTRGPDQALPGVDALAMLDAARAPRALLDRLLRRVSVHDGIAAGARVDLWLEDRQECTRGVVVCVGHRFSTPTEVELRPYVKYVDPAAAGQKRHRLFDEYAEFVACWKQAKYVVEQQAMLTQEARAQGVARGALVCVVQSPRSARWPFRQPGTLDAEVVDLAFDWDAETRLVSLRVLTRYATKGFKASSSSSSSKAAIKHSKTSGANDSRNSKHGVAKSKSTPVARPSSNKEELQRRVSLAEDDQLALEWVPFEALLPRLRSRVVLSDIQCSSLDFDAAAAGAAGSGGAELRPFIKLVLGQSKRKTPPSAAGCGNGALRWVDVRCAFREGESGNRVRRRATTSAAPLPAAHHSRGHGDGRRGPARSHRGRRGTVTSRPDPVVFGGATADQEGEEDDSRWAHHDGASSSSDADDAADDAAADDDSNRRTGANAAEGDAADDDSAGPCGDNEFFQQVLEVRVFAERRRGARVFMGMALVPLWLVLRAGAQGRSTVLTRRLGPSEGKHNLATGSVTLSLTATGPGVLNFASRSD